MILLAAAAGSLLACSPREPSNVGTGEDVFEVRETGEGAEVLDGGDLVLFYQRELKDHDGQFSRSNYLHPLMGLDGEVLTEDFPEDHLHHRGVFWAWHQLWEGEERLGDGWILEDFITEVTAVETRVTDETARLEARVSWTSPRFRGGEAFVEERTAIVVHRVADDARAIDFEIALSARVPGIRIGGSEDEKGYGGFSARVRMPEGLTFTGESGPVTPQNLRVEAGPWVDMTAPYGPRGEVSGLTLLGHPDNPGFPQPWILRQAGSMQNAVFPTGDTVDLPTQEPLVLRYRLVIHRGRATKEDVEGWRAAYAGPGREPPGAARSSRRTQ